MTANPIRVAVNGYGNLGRGVEKSILAAPDMELVAIFTRRDPASLDTLSGKAVSIDDMADYQGKVDVCVNWWRFRHRPYRTRPSRHPVLQHCGLLRHPRQDS